MCHGSQDGKGADLVAYVEQQHDYRLGLKVCLWLEQISLLIHDKARCTRAWSIAKQHVSNEPCGAVQVHREALQATSLSFLEVADAHRGERRGRAHLKLGHVNGCRS